MNNQHPMKYKKEGENIYFNTKSVFLTHYYWCPKCGEGFTFFIQKMEQNKSFSVRCSNCRRIVGFFISSISENREQKLLKKRFNYE